MDVVSLGGEVLRHVAGMAWKIAWGLVLGFGISAFIQAFVSRERVAEHLGALTPRSLALATGVGAASSSCSYAAAAMSKTLFQKGAHVVNATAFLFASTNLVIEIGLVIWMLLGWRFLLAELVGGVLLIAVMALLLRLLAPKRILEEARRHLEQRAEEGGHDHGGEALPLAKITSMEGVRTAAGYFAMDWSMIGRDIVLGLVIAGSLAALVPSEWWSALFLSPGAGEHPGLGVSIENAVLGPVIAILSFVCSVGNIPLAAVLWAGGISFGGVVAFIYADLVTIPMVLVYRRYYGWRPALAYAALLLFTMIVVALLVDAAFRLLGLAPAPGTGEGMAGRRYFAWDYTTFLNLVFVPLGVALFALGRRAHGGASHG
jgi:uncharacterized membrane protein YraQ (UPF0718 family)